VDRRFYYLLAARLSTKDFERLGKEGIHYATEGEGKKIYDDFVDVKQSFGGADSNKDMLWPIQLPEGFDENVPSEGIEDGCLLLSL